MYIQPASGDNGTALGAAYWVWNQILQQPRGFVMTHGYWGPAFANGSIGAALAGRSDEMRAMGCELQTIADDETLYDWTAARIAEGLVVGWFQGRMEWGARALGNRSILADPRRADMREIINTKIKFREKFRPFAPSVLAEAHAHYFTGSVPDPFMIQVYPVQRDKQAVIPAVTHVDGSGRLQTVDRDGNPRYWSLIRAFERRTGVPDSPEHVVQRERADRAATLGSTRLFPQDTHGRAGARQPGGHEERHRAIRQSRNRAI